ncbi:MAG: AAA family ATPase [Deltaproteobacteria bacterium]
MSMLNIVIADNDEEFIEAFERFLEKNYRERFQAVCITTSKYLNEYLKGTSKKIDILLIASVFVPMSNMENVNTVIVMTDGRITTELGKFKTLEKYQGAQNLVRRIIDIYAENNPNEIHIPFSDKKTKIISVFSPNGGTGKTTVSIAAALRLAQRGEKVFYLNFESFSSTAAFLNCKSETNLSHVLYFLKEKSKNLSLKIEGVKLKDLNSGLYYFAPTDMPLEINEIDEDDAKELVNQLKAFKYYDYIIIDMPSVMDEKNIRLFQLCDSIIYIFTPDRISQIKSFEFFKALGMTEKKELKGIENKLRFIINKFDGESFDTFESLGIQQRVIEVKIPEMPGIFSGIGNMQGMRLDNGFGESVNQLVSMILGVNEDGSL